MIVWPDQLVSDLARRRAILVIGSGVSRHSVGEGGAAPPTWGMFLNDALNLCDPAPKHIATALRRGQYLDACEWLKNALDDRWTNFLRDSFLTPKYKPAKIHELLYQIDTRVVITPNFDRIYDHHAQAVSEGTTMVKKPTDNDIIESVRRGDRVILKAHGSIEDPSNMVFTRSQYATARTKYLNFYRLLDALIMTSTVLMIGVGLDDPDFQLLFEDTAARYVGSPPHYMTFGGKPSDDLVKTMRDARNIKLLPYSSKNNHEQLVSSLEKLVAAVAESRSKLALTNDW